MEWADFREGAGIFSGLLFNLFSRNGGAAGAPECQLSVTFHSCAYSQSKVCSDPVVQVSHLSNGETKAPICAMTDNRHERALKNSVMTWLLGISLFCLLGHWSLSKDDLK